MAINSRKLHALQLRNGPVSEMRIAISRIGCDLQAIDINDSEGGAPGGRASRGARAESAQARRAAVFSAGSRGKKVSRRRYSSSAASAALSSGVLPTAASSSCSPCDSVGGRPKLAEAPPAASWLGSGFSSDMDLFCLVE
jgi:hypothetical protein